MRQIGNTLLMIALSLALTGPVSAGRLSATHRQQISLCSINSTTAAQSGVVAALDGPVALTEGSTRLTLHETDPGKTLAARIAAISTGRHFHLVLKDLQVREQPGILYRVYVDLPADAKPGRDDPHYAGLINFFNAQISGDARSTTDSSIFFSHDITSLLKNLQTQKLLSGETTITIIPSGSPAANSQPTIGRIEIVQQ